MKLTPLHILCGTLLTLLNAAALAHDIALIPDAGGNLTVRYGHPGDWQPTDKERLLEIMLFQSSTAPSIVSTPLVKNGLALTASAPVIQNATAALVAARYDNGLWVTTEGGGMKPIWHNTSRAMLPGGKTSLVSLKYAKGLFGKADDAMVYKREVGHLIELIPQSNPTNSKVGESITFMVKFKGKPLPNAEVEITDDSVLTVEGQKKYMTDRQGMARVPIRLAGLNVASVDYKHANDGSLGKAFKALPVESVMMVATFAFQL
jgi:nickel transport protein